MLFNVECDYFTKSIICLNDVFSLLVIVRSPTSLGHSSIKINIYRVAFFLLQDLLVGGERGSKKILTWYQSCLGEGSRPGLTS